MPSAGNRLASQRPASLVAENAGPSTSPADGGGASSPRTATGEGGDGTSGSVRSGGSAPAQIDQQHAALVTAERAIDLHAGAAMPDLVVQQHHAGQEAAMVGHANAPGAASAWASDSV